MTKKTIKHGELIGIRWKTDVCTQGESCWCRMIVPEEDCAYEDGTEVFVSASGELNQEMAEHFVELHNSWLNNMIEPQGRKH